jgi:NTE family protein
LNRLYFPTRGWALGLKYFDSVEANYSRLDLTAAGAFSLGKTVINGRMSHTSSPTGVLPFYNSGSLGGVLNMSAFARGQLVGDNMTYAGLRAEQIIGDLGLGMRGDLRIGMILEGAHIGKMYTEPTLQSRQIIPSVGAYFASETPIGPAYLGFGYAPGGYTNLFFNLGIP